MSITKRGCTALTTADLIGQTEKTLLLNNNSLSKVTVLSEGKDELPKPPNQRPKMYNNATASNYS